MMSWTLRSNDAASPATAASKGRLISWEAVSRITVPTHFAGYFPVMRVPRRRDGNEAVENAKVDLANVILKSDI